jgi:hypothetical protein
MHPIERVGKQSSQDAPSKPNARERGLHGGQVLMTNRSNDKLSDALGMSRDQITPTRARKR